MNEKQAEVSDIQHPISFSDEELSNIDQIKRFLEWLEGDPEFASAVTENALNDDQLTRLKNIGVHFDSEELSLIWEKPEIYLKLVLQGTNVSHKEDKTTAEETKQIAQFPLLALWAKSIQQKNNSFCNSKNKVFKVPDNKKYDAWRTRRIASGKSELGKFGYMIDHPVFAFELGDGCSVGCWFCAFATRKLKQNFDYAENKAFFEQIVQSGVKLFGKKGAAMALLYYGTEPHDNPDYLDCIKEYHRITGEPLCTSTAVVTDAPWLREMIAYYREHKCSWPRLSVLSKELLYQIHDLYTPEELRDVSLLMQMKDHQRCKVTGGRILTEQNGLKERDAGHYTDSLVPQGSIACVSGFLVNMVHQTIKLISPCYTSEKWPYGYRVFDTLSFTDAADYQQAIETLIERNMPDCPPADARAAFRDDLDCRITEAGFDLISPNQIHHFKGNNGSKAYKDLGALIAQGELSYRELFERMIEHNRCNPLVITAMVKHLFDAGLLDELYNHVPTMA